MLNRIWLARHQWFVPVAAIVLFFLTRAVLFLAFRASPEAFNADLTNEYWLLSDVFLGREDSHALLSYIEPGYPALIAFARRYISDSYLGVFIFRSLVACIGCVYFYFLSYKISQKRSVALIAVVLYIFYPYYLRSALKINDVSFFRTILVMSAFHLMGALERHRHAVLSGILLGMALMVRFMFFPGVILSAGYLLWKRRWKQALIVLSVCAFTASPMFFYFWRTEKTLMPTRGGINFYLGNNPFYSRIYPLYHVDTVEAYAHSLYREAHPGRTDDLKMQDRFYYAKALEFIRLNPDKFIKNKIRNLLLFFDPWVIPRFALGRFFVEVHNDESFTVRNLSQVQAPLRNAVGETLHAFARFVILLFGVLGIWLRRKIFVPGEVLLLGFWLVFLGVYTLFWPSTRLYSPVMFVFMFYAAFSIHKFYVGSWAARVWYPCLARFFRGLEGNR